MCFGSKPSVKTVVQIEKNKISVQFFPKLRIVGSNKMKNGLKLVDIPSPGLYISLDVLPS